MSLSQQPTSLSAEQRSTWGRIAAVLGAALAGAGPKVIAGGNLNVEVNAQQVTPEMLAELQAMGVEVSVVNRRTRRRRARGGAKPLPARVFADGRTEADIRRERNAAKRQRRERAASR